MLGILEIIEDPSLSFYSCLFVVEKASWGWRPVIDLFPLKKFIRQTPFRMGAAFSVLKSVRKGDFVTSVDLKDSYF